MLDNPSVRVAELQRRRSRAPKPDDAERWKSRAPKWPNVGKRRNGKASVVGPDPISDEDVAVEALNAKGRTRRALNHAAAWACAGAADHRNDRPTTAVECRSDQAMVWRRQRPRTRATEDGAVEGRRSCSRLNPTE